MDADLAWSHARFRNADPAGNYIPGAATANLGLAVDRLGPWFGALRLGYRFSPQMQLALDVYNLFERKVNDIEYWHESQLASESSPVSDRHRHPSEPRSLRLSLSHRF